MPLFGQVSSRLLKNPFDPRAAQMGRLEIVSGGHPQTPAKGGAPQKGRGPWTPLFQHPAGVEIWGVNAPVLRPDHRAGDGNGLQYFPDTGSAALVLGDIGQPDYQPVGQHRLCQGLDIVR